MSKSRSLKARKLLEVYQKLRRVNGHQKWWPGDTPFEIIIGAILTQNTAWTNVEKAIVNLKRAGVLNPEAFRKMPHAELAELIRPAGYFNVKSARIKNFIDFLFREYEGNLDLMKLAKGKTLRKKLLSVNGIGPETADSILLYAFGKPFFVIDAYTIRIFKRHGLIPPKEAEDFDYHDWQNLFMSALPANRALYNDFHAQIVLLAKNFCKSSQVFCENCPLNAYL